MMLSKQDSIKIYKHMINNYNKDFKPDVIHYFLLMVSAGLSPKQIYDNFVEVVCKNNHYYIMYKNKLVLSSKLVGVLSIPRKAITNIIRPYRLVTATPKLVIPIIIREVNKALPYSNIKKVDDVYGSYGKVLTADYTIPDILSEIDNGNCKLSKKFFKIK